MAHRVGTVSRLISAVLSAFLIGLTLARADEIPAALTTITLDRSVHFPRQGGAPVVVAPGSYRVEPAGLQQLQLLAEERMPLVIDAMSQSHGEVEIDMPVAVSLLDNEDKNLLHIVLVLPDGRGFEAVGSFSGVFQRRIPVHMMVAVVKTFATGTPIQDLDVVTREAGIARPGGDYRTYRLPLGACHMLCYKDQQCRVFTWEQDPAKPGRGQCHLKRAVPNAVEDPASVSGVKRGANPASH